MPRIDSADLQKRIADLVADPDGATFNGAHRIAAAATSLLTFAYGAKSPQLESFRAHVAEDRDNPRLMCAAGRAALQTLSADLELGLTGSLGLRGAGDVLGDLVGLAREALESNTEGANNVAAVLTAAALEDALRRLGEEKAGVVGRPRLESVIDALKAAGELPAARARIAGSLLGFRNDALHADWKRLDRGATYTALEFVQRLLLDHFG